MASATIDAQPAPVSVDPDRCALLIIDMQRDFLEPGGFGDALGNDVSQLRAVVGRAATLLDARAGGRNAGHPHPRRAPAGPVGCTARQGRARLAVDAYRRYRARWAAS